MTGRGKARARGTVASMSPPHRGNSSYYGALELLFGVTGTFRGVAHFAHLGGLAGGFLLMRLGRRRRRR